MWRFFGQSVLVACQSKFRPPLAPFSAQSQPTLCNNKTRTRTYMPPSFVFGPERTFPAWSNQSTIFVDLLAKNYLFTWYKATMGRDGSKPKVIIFDWDDTICPSSFFDRQQIERMDQLPHRVSARCSLAVIFGCTEIIWWKMIRIMKPHGSP